MIQRSLAWLRFCYYLPDLPERFTHAILAHETSYYLLNVYFRLAQRNYTLKLLISDPFFVLCWLNWDWTGKNSLCSSGRLNGFGGISINALSMVTVDIENNDCPGEAYADKSDNNNRINRIQCYSLSGRGFMIRFWNESNSREQTPCDNLPNPI